ncbi:DUF1007 family protein [Paracoccus sp. MBLB3053]|uniref:DUF1007 family protein n=1 Tax=Paracoccus aurantius TaxID=3073814 RepID=A0ABU2HW36_9RHOB|nr:DUF1007 family protein [Paracoccus sp. MBLB3053]MDS9468499.1 DUF1007 family protein [Paracoccus sp. MBLB3053]
MHLSGKSHGRGLNRRSISPVAALAAAVFLSAAGSAAAHPHVFIDADAALIFDRSGRPEAVRVTWTYDEFYSLMMIEDAELDRDGDGTPDPDRLRAFAGQDVDWAAGFPGHILLERDGKPVELAPPRAHQAHYVDGRIVTSHVRPLKNPAALTAQDALWLRIYDPEYFVAYDTPRSPTIEGRQDCKVTRRPPDTSGQSELLAALQNLDMEADSISIMNMPDVGITFAEGFEIKCGER